MIPIDISDKICKSLNFYSAPIESASISGTFESATNLKKTTSMAQNA